MPHASVAMPLSVFLFLSLLCLVTAFAAWLNTPKRHRKFLSVAMLALLVAMAVQTLRADGLPYPDPCDVFEPGSWARWICEALP